MGFIWFLYVDALLYFFYNIFHNLHFPIIQRTDSMDACRMTEHMGRK